MATFDRILPEPDRFECDDCPLLVVSREPSEAWGAIQYDTWLTCEATSCDKCHRCVGEEDER